jgi:hypothetical protein
MASTYRGVNGEVSLDGDILKLRRNQPFGASHTDTVIARDDLIGVDFGFAGLFSAGFIQFKCANSADIGHSAKRAAQDPHSLILNVRQQKAFLPLLDTLCSQAELAAIRAGNQPQEKPGLLRQVFMPAMGENQSEAAVMGRRTHLMIWWLAIPLLALSLLLYAVATPGNRPSYVSLIVTALVLMVVGRMARLVLSRE